MNIGFHYYVTKCMCMKAGFTEREAQIVAYACQYTDDATYHKKMKIRNMPEPKYERMGNDWFDPTCTSYDSIFIYNLAKEGPREKVLKPFHFMPPSGEYVVEAASDNICQMVQTIVEKLRETDRYDPDRRYKLIQLGIALHTLQDSFAHSGFSARNNAENKVSKVFIDTNYKRRRLPLWTYLKGLLGFNIGHARLSTYPDKFNTVINYVNNEDNKTLIRTWTNFRLAAIKTLNILGGKGDQEIGYNMFYLWNRNERTRRAWEIRFKRLFPEMNFYYDKREWEKKTVRRNIIGMRYYNRDDIWFEFHEAAHRQRMYAMARQRYG